jgi:hypothetical protein
MSFTVDWRPSAEDDLARLWTGAPSERNAITAAAAALDAALRRDPLALGESRSGTSRVAFEGPLAIAFDVFPEQRRVLVKAVWRSR